MKPLLDSDLLLDVAQNREPHVHASQAVLEWAEKKPGRALIAWHTVANIYYLLRRSHGDADARRFIRELVDWAKVIPTSNADVKRALGFQMSDFEDALQLAAAIAGDADMIVSRNVSDYAASPLRVITPAAFVVEISR
jgi:predicted nucleic acid-binding protein